MRGIMTETIGLRLVFSHVLRRLREKRLLINDLEAYKHKRKHIEENGKQT